MPWSGRSRSDRTHRRTRPSGNTTGNRSRSRSNGAVEKNGPRRFGRSLNTPAVHFAVIGAALFFATAARMPAADERADSARQPIVIEARRVEELRRDYAESMGKTPDAAAVSRILEDEINDELLYREAVRLGFDRAD